MDKLHQLLLDHGSDQEQRSLLPVASCVKKAVANNQAKALSLNLKIKTQLTIDLMTNDELAELLKCSKRTLANYRKKGILPFQRFGGKIYYRKKDIDWIFEIKEDIRN